MQTWTMALRRLRAAGWLMAALCLGAPAHALDWSWLDGQYTRTRHPVVLVHGLFGFDSIAGVVDYFHGVREALSAGGARVYTVQLSAADSHEERGEQLLQQLQALQAAHGHERFNLIGHSQGGLASRYVAHVAPQLVASVTQVQTPNFGSKVADWLTQYTIDHPEQGEQLVGLTTELLKVVDWLTGAPDRQHDVLANIFQLTTPIATSWNSRYPHGRPNTPCGSGPRVAANGVHYYSVGGVRVNTNALDLSDHILGVVSRLGFADGEPNDGLVGRCSTRWGEVLRDDYPWNHIDQMNHAFGLRGLFAPDPVAVYRAHANRLKQAGL